MSQNGDKASRERSVKLTQLICDRQIDNEIGFEIRKLFAEGVLIDFQDQNRDKKTALHLAVDKCDVTCVKFLLQFKPSLEVKDEDGKTSIELARSKGFQNIVNVLLNSTVDVLIKSYIEVIDYESLTRQKIEAIKSRPSFKVLKLINCPSSNEVWLKLYDHDYVKRFNKSSHLFFIAIETNEMIIDNNHKLMKTVLNLRRPMIVQLSSPNCPNTKIFFKDDKKDFVEIIDSPQMTQGEFDEAVLLDDCNLKLLVAALRSNLFGHFTSDLLDTKLKNNEDRSEAVNQFARSNALCHRFFKLFDECQPQIDTIIAALSFKGDQSLLALLDLPFELNDEKLKLTENQQDIMTVVDCCGCNFLMMAAEQNNLDGVKLLLRCGCDFNHSDYSDKRASDICWEMKAFDCLAELIEAGSPYPNNFCNSKSEGSSEAFKRINAMTEVVNSFHANIAHGEVEEVKKFMTSHPHIKHAYDSNNKCALTVALQSGKVDIYSLLMSEGFEPGADDEYQSACLKSNYKNEIRNSHKKYFKEAFDEPHLKRLLKMFQLSFGSKDRAKCSTIIRKMFDELNEIDEIIPILQICSTSDKLRIVFDFNCDSVVDMIIETGSRSVGVVYPIEGFVYIGAKNCKTDFYEVIGALIHELTHYAMKLTYDNSCRPYNHDDEESKNQFEDITKETKKICDENSSTNPIVSTVFSCYTEQVWHQELIVRVNHLLAHYKMNPSALKAAERNTSELFHFYREKTLKDVTIQSRVLHKEFLIRKINKQTGIVKKIENMKVQFENVESVDLKSSVNVITSNAPQLTLAMLNQILESDSHIFVTLEQVAIGNVLDKIAKINSRQSSTVLIVDCIGWAQKYSESLRNLPKKLKNIKTIAMVIKEIEGSAVKEIFPSAESKTYTHKWAELTEDTKLNLLNKIVSFQGIEMALSGLVEPSSEAMNFFPLSDILDCKDFKIGHPLHQPSHNFYIARKLIKKGQATTSAKGFDEIIRVDTTMCVMIISDEAGSGKSVILFEMAKLLFDEFPDRWVLFVDLKRHIEAFKCIEDYKKIETFQDFISELILKNETEFDRELFKKMFRDGKTFILFDGFDEISPNYKNLLFHVLKLFTPELGNRIFITTRPHLEEDLEGALGKFVFNFEEFSDKSQKSFLRNYWQSVAFKSDTDFEVLSDRLLEKFSVITNSSFIGLPLLMRMTAEIFNDPTKGNSLDNVESLNVASIFREFVDKYLERWKETGSEIARKENVEIERDGGILEIHHSIAIKHKFGGKFEVLEIDEGDAEKIARVGLIRYDKTEKTFQFVHETFAEYFVADYIYFNLKRKNRNPSHDCQMVVELLIELVKDDHRVVKIFLDQTLESNKFSLKEASCQSLGKCFSELVKIRGWFGILREILGDVRLNDYDNILILLLSIIKYADKDFLLRMLESRDVNQTNQAETALHNAATFRSIKIVSALCNIIATRIDNPKKIFKLINRQSENVLFSAASNKNRGVLSALEMSLNTVFTNEEIKVLFQHENRHGDNIIYHAAKESSADVLCELISLLREYLSADELRSQLLAVGRIELNCFQQAVAQNTMQCVKTLIDLASNLLDTENLKTFLQQDSGEMFFHRRNIFLLAAQNRNEKIFQTLVESTCGALSRDDFKFMLMKTDWQGSNVLHIATEYGTLALLNDLNSLLREYLSDDDIRSLLWQFNEKGENCFRLVDYRNDIDFQAFCKLIGNLLPREDQTRLLQESSHQIKLFKLISGVNNKGEGVPIESIKLILTEINSRRHNAFHGAKFVIRHLSSILSRNQLGVMLKQKDSDCRNILFFLTDSGVLKTFISFLKKILSTEEIRSLVLDKDRKAQTCLEYSVSSSASKLYSRSDVIRVLSNYIKTILNHDDQRKYFATKNLFHLAVENRCKEIFSTIHKCLQGVFTGDEIKMMMQSKDSNGNNIFHLICQCKLFFNDFRVRFVLKDIFKTLNAKELKDFLTSSNNQGENCLLLAVKLKNEEFLENLVEIMKAELSLDDLRNMIQKHDNDGKNIFQCASHKNLSFVKDFVRGILTDEQYRMLNDE